MKNKTLIQILALLTLMLWSINSSQAESFVSDESYTSVSCQGVSQSDLKVEIIEAALPGITLAEVTLNGAVLAAYEVLSREQLEMYPPLLQFEGKDFHLDYRFDPQTGHFLGSFTFRLPQGEVFQNHVRCVEFK